MSSPIPPPPLPPDSGQWAYPTDEKGEPKKKYVLWIVLGAAGCLGAIVVVGVLATVLVPNIVKGLSSAKRAAVQAQLQDLREALSVYAETHSGEYPKSLEALVLPDENGHTILRDERELPRDPWGHAFVYEPPAPGRHWPRLCSLGSDGRSGGAGPAEDVHAWPQAGEGR